MQCRNGHANPKRKTVYSENQVNQDHAGLTIVPNDRAPRHPSRPRRPRHTQTPSPALARAGCPYASAVPLLNLTKKFYGCNLIYTAGNDSISYLISAIGRYVVIRNNV